MSELTTHPIASERFVCPCAGPMCTCACLYMCEAGGRHWVSCSSILYLNPFKQHLSLNLEPAIPRNHVYPHPQLWG